MEEVKLNKAFIKAEDLRNAFVKVEEDEEEVIDPSEKTYIILYYIDIDDKEENSFEIIKGRKETYEFIKGMVECIDLTRSKILTDTVTYKDAISVYEFMSFASSELDDLNFHIDDYLVGDVD